MKILSNYFLLSFLIFFFSCEGKQVKDNNTQCNKDTAIKTIMNLPETKRQAKYVDSISNHKKGISIMVDSLKIKDENYYEIKTGYDGEFHWETYNIFYVNRKNCKEVLVNDTILGDIIPIDIWRQKKQNNNKMENNSSKITFSELFNEGSNIKFTPSDLDKNEDEIRNFKHKLLSFESSNPNSDDFNIDDLSILINNETFSNNESYIDSSWLDYFVKKYTISSDKIYSLMNLAIEQEDLNAVNILKEYYIISQVQIDEAEKKNAYVKSLNGKLDVDNYYDPSFSKIAQIETILRNSFSKNHIQDPDGFTNLRKSNNISSEILQKINSGEHIEVLDNSGDWFLVKSKEGKQGYVYKSRVKSN